MGPSNNKLLIDNLHCVTESHTRDGYSNPGTGTQAGAWDWSLPWATFLRTAAAAVHLMCSGRMI